MFESLEWRKESRIDISSTINKVTGGKSRDTLGASVVNTVIYWYGSNSMDACITVFRINSAPMMHYQRGSTIMYHKFMYHKPDISKYHKPDISKYHKPDIST